MDKVGSNLSKMNSVVKNILLQSAKKNAAFVDGPHDLNETERHEL